MSRLLQPILVWLFVVGGAYAQKPLLFQPCLMCDILDDDSSAKVLSYFADYAGTEYAFDSEAHRAEFLKRPDIWLSWSDEPEPDGHATLVPS